MFYHYISVIGVVEFEKVSLRYSSDLPYVLREVTFKTNPREKIGVVGRTGAGKSSLIQVLTFSVRTRFYNYFYFSL